MKYLNKNNVGKCLLILFYSVVALGFKKNYFQENRQGLYYIISDKHGNPFYLKILLQHGEVLFDNYLNSEQIDSVEVKSANRLKNSIQEILVMNIYNFQDRLKEICDDKKPHYITKFKKPFNFSPFSNQRDTIQFTDKVIGFDNNHRTATSILVFNLLGDAYYDMTVSKEIISQIAMDYSVWGFQKPPDSKVNRVDGAFENGKTLTTKEAYCLEIENKFLQKRYNSWRGDLIRDHIYFKPTMEVKLTSADPFLLHTHSIPNNWK